MRILLKLYGLVSSKLEIISKDLSRKKNVIQDLDEIKCFSLLLLKTMSIVMKCKFRFGTNK